LKGRRKLTFDDGLFWGVTLEKKKNPTSERVRFFTHPPHKFLLLKARKEEETEEQARETRSLSLSLSLFSPLSSARREDVVILFPFRRRRKRRIGKKRNIRQAAILIGFFSLRCAR
jgi:hypothetical protein